MSPRGEKPFFDERRPDILDLFRAFHDFKSELKVEVNKLLARLDTAHFTLRAIHPPDIKYLTDRVRCDITLNTESRPVRTCTFLLQAQITADGWEFPFKSVKEGKVEFTDFERLLNCCLGSHSIDPMLKSKRLGVDRSYCVSRTTYPFTEGLDIVKEHYESLIATVADPPRSSGFRRISRTL